MREHHAHVMSPEYDDIQEVYIKKEADAVIAEKDEQIAELVGLLQSLYQDTTPIGTMHVVWIKDEDMERIEALLEQGE